MLRTLCGRLKYQYVMAHIEIDFFVLYKTVNKNISIFRYRVEQIKARLHCGLPKKWKFWREASSLYKGALTVHTPMTDYITL